MGLAQLLGVVALRSVVDDVLVAREDPLPTRLPHVEPGPEQILLSRINEEISVVCTIPFTEDTVQIFLEDRTTKLIDGLEISFGISLDLELQIIRGSAYFEMIQFL